MNELDPELKGRVLEFVWDKRWVNHGRIAREFFSDDPDAATLYLDWLKSEGEILKVVNSSGQITWRPTAQATAGPIIPVRWKQYADGKTHTLSEDEIREKYGISIPQFRRRLSFTQPARSWRVSSSTENGTVQFRIEPDGFESRSPSKKQRNRNPVSHFHCDHPNTWTDRNTCARKKRARL
ncbi:hypothetical protein ACIHFB_06800 [Streptomyces sp. NPDC051963]|uniref:hypothetical protein n=1 Tax=Streptomyces sp. NPDC051963 TaxID=3365678 RepID=UPI0037CCE3F2